MDRLFYRRVVEFRCRVEAVIRPVLLESLEDVDLLTPQHRLRAGEVFSADIHSAKYKQITNFVSYFTNEIDLTINGQNVGIFHSTTSGRCIVLSQYLTYSL